MIMRRLSILCASTVLLLAGGEAMAQAPSTGFGLGAVSIPKPGKTVERTTGLRFGRSVFHAGLGIEGGWDSNVFYDASSAQSSGFLRFTPELTLGTATGKGKPPSVVYQLNLGLDYTAYLQDVGSGGKDRHMIGASAGASVHFNPQGIFQFKLLEQYVRTNEPRAGVDFGYNRDYNSVGFDMVINPGRGLISILVGYRFGLDYFENNRLDFASKMEHQATVKVDWRFFPLTTLWLKVETGYDDYFEDFSLATLQAGGGSNRDSVPLLVMLGATGRLTPKLSLDVGIGYRAFFYTDKLGITSNAVSDDHHDVAANVGLKWQIAPAAALALGYQHDSRDSVVGDYFKADSAYLSTAIAFASRLQLNAKVGWTLANFKGYILPATTTGSQCQSAGGVSICERKDNYLLVSVDLSYYFLSWLSAGLGYQLLANFSDFDAQFAGVSQNADFVKHRVYGLVSLYY